MPLDSNGVWIYEESEDAAPISALLNKLGYSLSDIIGELLTDSGTVGLTLTSGVVETSGYELTARQVGPMVFVSGRATKATATTTQTWAQLPVSITDPVNNIDATMAASTSFNNVGRLYLSPAGDLISQNTPTTTARIGFTLFYMLPS